MSDFMLTILTIMGSVLVTYFSLKSKSENDASHESLVNVYLPLERHLKLFKLNNNPTKEQINSFKEILDEVIFKQFLLVDDTLYNLSSKFNDSVRTETNVNKSFNILSFHINETYLSLKNKCGYTSSNKRKRNIQNFLMIVTYVCMFLLPILIFYIIDINLIIPFYFNDLNEELMTSHIISHVSTFTSLYFLLISFIIFLINKWQEYKTRKIEQRTKS